MRSNLVVGVLTAVNVMLVLGHALTQGLPALAADSAGILRGSAFELVDTQGRVRASLTIQPESAGASETVLFRLIQQNGQPSVKISTSATGAGLSFVGGDDESYIILEANGPESRLKMVERDGREHVVTP
jgi:hypothetical protein